MIPFKVQHVLGLAASGLLAFVLTTTVPSVGAFYNFRTTVGARLPGPGTSVAGPRDAVYCCRKCVSHGDCAAVNFNTATKTCELLVQNQTLLPFENSPDWTLYLGVDNSVDPMLGATVSESSTDYSCKAEDAIDGITSGDWYADKCTHSHADDTNPWWQLQLSVSHRIRGIKLWNRLDSGHYTRLNSLTIYVASTLGVLGDPSSVCGTFPGPPAQESDNPITINCQQDMIGRYIKIHKSIQEILNLCEVEVIWA